MSFVIEPLIDHHDACLPAAAASDESSLQTSTAQKPQCWAHHLEEGGLRDIEVESVTKMLACSTSILGVKHYTCGNNSCPHVKYLCNTRGCRAGSSCGKKATDQCIADQQHRLTERTWRHLVFTLPDTLWPLFFHNRHWLNALGRLAVDNLLYAGRPRGVEVDVFCAIHTAVTLGGG
ncbi:ISPsy3, transposase [Pseudomonas syringae pv. actinidiae ICMP 19096]|uniref:ISPsy3, transposase n=1 Tax=Pseudomonas syringae pv. actinidiae ICMP 19096 TaxID=1194405 RepID=A0A656JKW6_PSESF|nr:ISPsy3, transposase [Pseudomonas syringae pv. actinidiae ICMP 19096]